jgi:hypothetical protein
MAIPALPTGRPRAEDAAPLQQLREVVGDTESHRYLIHVGEMETSREVQTLAEKALAKEFWA